MWNSACVIRNAKYGQYNPETGYFELNGLTDITYEEAIKILQVSNVGLNDAQSIAFAGKSARTFIPPYNGGGAMSLNKLFENCQLLEVVRFNSYYTWGTTTIDTEVFNVKDTVMCFSGCNSLRRIESILQMPKTDFINIHFYLSTPTKLEYARIKGIFFPIYLFQSTPVIGIDSLQYAVENAENTSPISIYLHSTVFAKLVGEGEYPDGKGTREEWMALNELAISKNITFATT